MASLQQSVLRGAQALRSHVTTTLRTSSRRSFASAGKKEGAGKQQPKTEKKTKDAKADGAKEGEKAEGESTGFFARVVGGLKEGYKENEALQKSINDLSAKAKKLEVDNPSELQRKAKEAMAKSAEKVQETTSATGGLFSKWFGAKKDDEKEQKKPEASAQPLAAAKAKAAPKAAESSNSSSSAKQAAAGKQGAAGKKTDKKKEEDGPFTQAVNFINYLRKELIDDNHHAKRSTPYQSPVDRRRSAIEKGQRAAIEENTEDTGVVLHSESKWQSQWSNFKDNNPVLNGLFGLKMRFEESDNIVIRATRSITDTVTERLSGVFEEGEMSQTLEEIHRIDPNFSYDKFLVHCEKNVLPAVLEACLAGDKNTLKDWCSEACFNYLSAYIDQREAAGYKDETKILDLRNVELFGAKMLDSGPVLIMTFQTQRLKCIRDRTGAIKEGGENHIERVFNVFAMRRDQTSFHPTLAWQILEFDPNGVGAMEIW